MHSFVVRIALRQHVPLRTRVENPQHRFEHMTGWYRLTSRTSIGNMLLSIDPLPLFDEFGIVLVIELRRQPPSRSGVAQTRV
jgi:hypothetical protein